MFTSPSFLPPSPDSPLAPRPRDALASASLRKRPLVSRGAAAVGLPPSARDGEPHVRSKPLFSSGSSRTDPEAPQGGDQPRPPPAFRFRRPETGRGSEARPESRGVAVTCQAQVTCEAGSGRTPELSHSREMHGGHVTARARAASRDRRRR